jgi:hypothetical protein
MSTTATATGMALLLSGGAALALAETQPASESADFRLTLELDRTVYEIGEPIVATLQMINLTNYPRSVPTTSEPTGRRAGFSLAVTASGGQAFQDPHNEYVSLWKSYSSQELVPPAGSATRRMFVNYFTPILEPGRYSVKADFDPREARANTAPLRSAPVSFEIVATPPAARKDRVSRLVEQLRGGQDSHPVARLLGFTGQLEAIAPLVELLRDEEDDGVQVAAAEALRYLDRGRQKEALIESLGKHSPRSRLVYHFAMLRPTPEEMASLLLPWLSNSDERVRDAAIEGMRLCNGKEPDPALLAPLVTMLRDASPLVRRSAASAVGGYRGAEALRALTTVVRDPDPGVSLQATIAVGWVAQAAEPGSDLRREAVTVLRSMVGSGGRAGEHAARVLGKVAE